MNSSGTDLKVLIVGYGNPLRGDDAVGWMAAERLEASLRLEGVEIIRDHQLMPELAEPVSRAQLVIFIDACCDQPAGTVSCRPVVATASTGALSFSHGTDPGGILAAARAIYGSCGRAMLFSVGAESFDHGEKLSPVVEHAMDELLQQVTDLVEGWVGGCGDCGPEHCHA